MARPGLLTHRKFIRLARLLRSDALAYGHLGIIWDACYEAGDDNIGSAEDLEYLARWQGEAGLLASALLEAGFIDVDDAAIHRVHDLYDHAPDYVQRRMEREHQRRAKGVTISELRAKAGKASGESRRKHPRTNDEQVTNTCSTNGNTCRTHDEQTGTNGATPSTQHPTPALDTGVPVSLSVGTDTRETNGNGKQAPHGLLRLIELWNKIPEVQRCRDATPKRIAAFRQRSQKTAWMESVKQALEKVARSSFCTGRGKDGWIADIDWFLKPDTVTKIIEGKYDDRSQPTRVQPIPTGGTPIYNPETGEIVIKKE
jgi:hypothetical protein